MFVNKMSVACISNTIFLTLCDAYVIDMYPRQRLCKLA